MKIEKVTSRTICVTFEDSRYAVYYNKENGRVRIALHEEKKEEESIDNFVKRITLFDSLNLNKEN